MYTLFSVPFTWRVASPNVEKKFVVVVTSCYLNISLLSCFPFPGSQRSPSFDTLPFIYPLIYVRSIISNTVSEETTTEVRLQQKSLVGNTKTILSPSLYEKIYKQDEKSVYPLLSRDENRRQRVDGSRVLLEIRCHRIKPHHIRR